LPNTKIANSYDRDKAVQYAHTWAYGRNPQYYNFDNIGGDCTNFASQVLYGGGKPMNYKPTFGWYYNNVNSRTPSWSGVEFLYNFLIGDNGGAPYAKMVDYKDILYGDLIQLQFSGKSFQHTLIVVKADNPSDINNVLVATHTNDSDYRPLSTYSWRNIRFLHIL